MAILQQDCHSAVSRISFLDQSAIRLVVSIIDAGNMMKPAVLELSAEPIHFWLVFFVRTLN
jgi:hypothetical protein